MVEHLIVRQSVNEKAIPECLRAVAARNSVSYGLGQHFGLGNKFGVVARRRLG
jgi:hypothetical protein